MGEVEAGVERDRLAIGGDRLLALAGAELGRREVGEEREVARALADQLAEDRDGLVGLPGAERALGALEVGQQGDPVPGVDRTAARGAGAAQVAEAAERRVQLGVGERRRGLAHRPARLQLGERALQAPRHVGVLGQQVVALRGVGDEVDQLRPRPDDQPPAVVRDRLQRAPAVDRRRHLGLAVDRLARDWRAHRFAAGGGCGARGLLGGRSGGEPRQRLAELRRLARQPRQGEQRRRQPPARHRPLHHPAGGDAGAGDDQRHLQGRAVEQDAVRALAVLAERLAVVAHRRHHPPGRVARQRAEQPADLAIDVGDLPGVAPRLGVVGRRELPRRRVGGVRVVVVHPQEVGPAGRQLRRPGQRGVGHRGGVALRVAVLADLLGGHRVVVGVEAAVETEAAIEHPRGDERPGGVAVAGEHRGQRRQLLRQHRHPVVAHPVLRRVEPGQQRAVRRQGQRHRGQRPPVADPPRRQRVEHRRPRPGGAVAAEVVGAGGVEGEEDDVGRAARGRDVGAAEELRRQSRGQDHAPAHRGEVATPGPRLRRRRAAGPRAHHSAS